VEFETWINLVYIDQDIKLRDASSKHQAKIKEIWDAIEARDYTKLVSIKPVACPDERGDVVNYCKYLLHCLSILKNEGKQD